MYKKKTKKLVGVSFRNVYGKRQAVYKNDFRNTAEFYRERKNIKLGPNRARDIYK